MLTQFSRSVASRFEGSVVGKAQLSSEHSRPVSGAHTKSVVSISCRFRIKPSKYPMSWIKEKLKQQEGQKRILTLNQYLAQTIRGTRIDHFHAPINKNVRTYLPSVTTIKSLYEPHSRLITPIFRYFNYFSIIGAALLSATLSSSLNCSPTNTCMLTPAHCLVIACLDPKFGLQFKKKVHAFNPFVTVDPAIAQEANEQYEYFWAQKEHGKVRWNA